MAESVRVDRGCITYAQLNFIDGGSESCLHVDKDSGNFGGTPRQDWCVSRKTDRTRIFFRVRRGMGGSKFVMFALQECCNVRTRTYTLDNIINEHIIVQNRWGNLFSNDGQAIGTLLDHSPTSAQENRAQPVYSYV